MKKDLTELVFILDKSGSMSGLESDTIGGFNSFVEKEKKEEGEAVLSTILFNQNINVIHDRIDINDVKELTEEDYFTSGCTALLDAVGTTIKSIMKIHNELKDEAPANTLFVITTDGLENASKEYSYSQIKKMISAQQEKGWKFIFLGANIDSIKEARSLGIDEDNAVDYMNDGRGIRTNYNSIVKAARSLREKGKIESSWKEDIERNNRRKR